MAMTTALAGAAGGAASNTTGTCRGFAGADVGADAKISRSNVNAPRTKAKKGRRGSSIPL
jgi:hypothetical protein